MLNNKMMNSVGLILSTLLSSSAIAAINVDIRSSQSHQPFQTFDVDITSDIALKSLEIISLPELYCSLDFLPFQEKTVSGHNIRETVSFNYAQHRYTSGDNLCVFAEDIDGNKIAKYSDIQIALNAPKTQVNSALSTHVDSLLSIDKTRGDAINRVEFIYRQKHTSSPLTFDLKGEGSPNTDIVLTTFNGNIIAKSTVDKNNFWSLPAIPVSLSPTSVTGHANYYLKTVASFDENLTLSQQRFYLQGKKVYIELIKKPQDPIIVDQYESGTASWDLHTPLSIINTKIVLLSEQQSCHLPHKNVVKSIEVSGRHFNFSRETQLHGNFACLQITDDLGRSYYEDIGWIRQQAKPEIIIEDDVESSLVDSDNINGYFIGAKHVSVRYISDRGTLSRDAVMHNCVSSNVGTPVDSQSLNLILSDPTLHERYMCITADNGTGGITHWLSDNKLQLTNGISQAPNVQQRGNSTPFPTRLAIPTLQQNATIANSGCRGILLAPDLVFSAAHCQAPFFFPQNGVWAQAPEKYGFLTPQDEKPQQQYNVAIRALYKEFQESGEYSDEAYEKFNSSRKALYDELNQYHNSHYNVYISPYFDRSGSAARTFSDFVLRELHTPYTKHKSIIEYPLPLVYSHPSTLHLTAGEYRSHGIHEQTPNSGWRGGNIHVLATPGTSIVEYTLVETAGGESGSALWAYDPTLDTYGVIGSVRGGGAWSSMWSHGRITRQALAKSRAMALQRRQQAYQGNAYSYQDLRRAIAIADITLLNKIIDSGIDLNINGTNQTDGWVLARAIDFAMQAHQKLLKRNNEKHQQKFENRVNVITALMLGGANPQLTVTKPTRFMDIKAGDSVLHYAIRTNNREVMKAIWLNTTNYEFESLSRVVTNDAGDTPLHIAIVNQTDFALTKMLFADVKDHIFTQNSQGESPLSLLLKLGPQSSQGIKLIDWVGKAYSYEPVQITNAGDISHDEWKSLYCATVDVDGSSLTFTQYAVSQQAQLSESAFAAISRLGNVSGVDANQYCNN